jgi:hypothetical protein
VGKFVGKNYCIEFGTEHKALLIRAHSLRTI